MHVSRACLSHAWPIAAYPASLADQNGHLHMSKPKTKPAGENDVHKMHVQGWEMLSISEEHVSLQGGVGLPSIDNLVCILQEHRKKKNLARSRQVYLHLCDNGLEAHTVLGNYLVPMLVECGSVATAQQIFEKLAHQNEYAWTSLLHGYIEWGESHLALDSFQKMQDNQVHPSMHTFVALVKACESLRDMVSGQEMHTEVVKRGCERDPFVSNCLLCMYAKCGSVADAQGVFDQLPVREIISWTALMTAYVEFGLSNEALNCLEHIKMEGLSPDSIMFVCILKACGSLGALDRGQEIHAEIIIEGLERDSSVGNTLLDMYVKCGSLVEAQGLFDELPVRDLVSWTALMAGFAENGLGEEAVGCLEQMQSEGMFPDAIMYVCCLKACCSIRAIDKGLKLHGEIAQEGFQVDQIVGNTLVDMYAKFGLLAEAQAVFDQLPMRDVVSWTALIAGYAECDFCEDVQNCLKQMQLEGCSPNTATYICSLKACSRVETLNWGREMHTKFTKEGFERETFMGSALVDMYAKCGSFLEAHAVLNELPVQNVVSWSALIAGYAEYGASEVAFKCLEQMEQVGMSPSVVTLVSSLKACSSTGALESGYKIHAEIVKKGFERDLLCGNALIDMYAKCGSLSASRAVFNKLPSRDAISWTALMAGYAERGLGEEAMKCLGEMQLECVPMDIMLWNTIILCYAEQGESEKALLPYARMQEQGLPPNSITFVSILQACCKTAALETGHRIHAQIRVVKKLEATEDLLSTALIDMYGKCGSMADAQQVFDMMSTRDLVQWNALITGYARQGESELVFILFDKMREEGVQPDGVTFSSVLFVCSHAGLVDKGLTYYETMVKEYSITPTMKHYSCMVDLLGRIGQLNEAVVMLEKMPVQPDLVAWNTVLGACRKLGDVELGEQAFDSSMRLGEQDPTSFILMANIYADVPT